MSKEEPGRLLSKVAKFVRNPLKDWTELDAQDSTSSVENGYTREMLKEMIERRQRNDFVRRREFDMLRKLRQREAAGERDAAHPSSFNVSSTSGKTEGRALTLKKIDEIEEQMSQQWWKGRAPDGDARPSANAEVMAAQHARAYADTLPGVSPGDTRPPPVVAEPQAATPATLPPFDSALEEAAIRFAQDDDAGAEAILLQALAPDSVHADHDDTWLALLDLYRAIGDAEKFGAASTRYAQRIRRQGPEWISLRALARSVQAAAAADASAAAGTHGAADWRSAPVLTRDGLGELTRSLSLAGPVWALDWRALTAIDADAAGPLRVLFTHWADSPVELRFFGGARLLAVLEQATPVNDRQRGEFWWQLRMAALRVMHEVDPFELVALNYCITYEVSPPPWEDPRGRYASLEESEAAPPAKPAFSLASLDDLPDDEPADAGHATLAGELRGDSLSTWQRLDAEIAGTPSPAISCGPLVRMDMAAAATLLTWVTARDARGEKVRFVDAHRLVAVFFGVIGIADHAEVTVRNS